MILSPSPDPPPLFLLSPHLPHLFLTPFVQCALPPVPASACTCPGLFRTQNRGPGLLKYLSFIVPKTFPVFLALFWFSRAWACICLLSYLWVLSQMYNSSLVLSGFAVIFSALGTYCFKFLQFCSATLWVYFFSI